ncbi:MAG: ABC transporter ATP-binding protein [Bacteroidetes bacterium]|nr:ABC transporter ATP-binding protein [Bacteroidota bacterium]
MFTYSSSGLTVELGKKEILHGLEFQVESGQWIGLLGPNGAGKTTLLRAMAGLLEYHGSLKLLDREIRDYRPRERAKRLALVRQTHALAFDFRVDELVLLGRSPYKSLLSVYDNSDLDRVSVALSLVDLKGFRERVMSSLSGGEQQRVFLAQALVQEADILLLDEPTTHLDVHHQYEFLYRVQEFVSEGKTVVGAFHDLELAARFSTHLLILQHGNLVASGPPELILNESLIADVFEMDAAVLSGETAADSSMGSSTETAPLRIMYQRPLKSNRK